MSEVRVHWRSKIKVSITGFSRDVTTKTKGSEAIDLNSTIVLSTVQSYDPQITTNADVNDSITSERIGYLIRPGRITIALVVLAARPTDRTVNSGYSDAELLSIIQFGRIFFDMNVEHDGISHDDFGDGWTWENCIITDSNPSQLTIDGRPTATFNLAALGLSTTEGSF